MAGTTKIFRVNTETVTIQSEVQTQNPDGTPKTDQVMAYEAFHQVIKFALQLEEVIE